MSRSQTTTYRNYAGNVLFVAGCIALAAAMLGSTWMEAAVEIAAGITLLGISHLFYSFRARWDYLYRRNELDRSIPDQRDKP